MSPDRPRPGQKEIIHTSKGKKRAHIAAALIFGLGSVGIGATVSSCSSSNAVDPSVYADYTDHYPGTQTVGPVTQINLEDIHQPDPFKHGFTRFVLDGTQRNLITLIPQKQEKQLDIILQNNGSVNLVGKAIEESNLDDTEFIVFSIQKTS